MLIPPFAFSGNICLPGMTEELHLKQVLDFARAKLFSDYPIVMVMVFVLTVLPSASVMTQYIRRPELAAVSVAL